MVALANRARLEEGATTQERQTTMTAAMSDQDITEVMNRPHARELLASPIPARLAYTGLDRSPRVVPVGYDWDGTHITVASAVTSAKTKALQANPNVALTIDSEDFPPKVLLLRGTARLEIVDGVPDIFLRASKRRMSQDQWPDWKAGVQALYDQMAVITITPTWAKLLDFETTIPKAEHDIMHARSHDASATTGAIYQD
uniref:pyridoxamine 5'-phosphate oxidase family protein n=1 Tax=Actinomadura sp. CA-154981 TaxID=3240037 RepID=UPI003F498F62